MMSEKLIGSLFPRYRVIIIGFDFGGHETHEPCVECDAPVPYEKNPLAASDELFCFACRYCIEAICLSQECQTLHALKCSMCFPT